MEAPLTEELLHVAWACDRCDAFVRGRPGDALPDGWTLVPSFGGGPVSPRRLCAACSARRAGVLARVEARSFAAIRSIDSVALTTGPVALAPHVAVLVTAFARLSAPQRGRLAYHADNGTPILCGDKASMFTDGEGGGCPSVLACVTDLRGLPRVAGDGSYVGATHEMAIEEWRRVWERMEPLGALDALEKSSPDDVRLAARHAWCHGATRVERRGSPILAAQCGLEVL